MAGAIPAVRNRSGIGEGGGGAGEGSCARNRSLVAGGGRSTEGGDDGASARAPLGSGRSEEEERNDKWVSHPSDKYLGDAWRTVRRPRADCPRGRCYMPLLGLDVDGMDS